MIINKAKWITDPVFTVFTPLNLFRKENERNAVVPAHREALRNVHMLIRKVFSIKQPNHAVINITADDYYKLYINGHFVGQGPAPSYHFHYNVNEYDISQYLVEGDNVIAVHVYYQGLVNRVWNSGDYRMGLLAEITQNGNVVLATDNTWKFCIADEFVSRERTGYDTQFVEDIDNRRKIVGWKDLKFDDRRWENVVINKHADYTLVPQITPSVQVYNIQPEVVREIAPGNLLIDFGKETTGRLLVEAMGKKGQVLEIHYGEEMETPDKVRGNMRCNCKYIEKWILAGSENDSLETYDYKAFRYVQILGAAAIKTETIAAEVRHYPFDDSACEFKSSNELLNNIWEICKNAVKIGTQEGYLDCPSREKGQYLGDATVMAQAYAYLTGDYTIFKKCLKDFALSSYICPGLMAVAPGNFMQEIADYSLQWPLQLLKYYELSADIEFLREMLPTVQGLIDYFKKFARADGLLENFNDKQVMVDWPENLRDGYDYKLMHGYEPGCNTVLNAYYIGAVKTANQIKKILGEGYLCEFEQLKKAFIAVFYNYETGLFVDSEVSLHSALHANVLPLYFGLVPSGSKVVQFIKKKRLHCGVYFSYFVLKALANAGEHEFVYELITCNDERSWATMVNEGATACFEAWGKNQKWNTSLCHGWGSSPIIVLVEDVAGIKTATLEKGEISFNPHFPKRLEYMEVSAIVSGKRIGVKWEGGRIKTKIDKF